MKTEIRTVDPKLAAAWLTQSKDNRPLRKTHINYLASEMTEGRWRLTHQGIAFDFDGNLMDGQHRLQAIKESGIPLPLQVSYYEAGDNINFAFPIIDRGLMRNMADITRLDTQIIQIYNVLLWLGTSKHRLPPDDYIIFDSKIGHTTREFLASCPFQRTYYTPAAVRAAGVAVLYLNKSPLSHVSQLFAAWGTGNTQNTFPIVGAFMNYVPSLRAEGRKANNEKLFVAGIYALSEKNAEKSRLLINQHMQDSTVNEVRSVVDNLMRRRDISKADLVAMKNVEISNLSKTLQKERAQYLETEQIRLSREARD